MHPFLRFTPILTLLAFPFATMAAPITVPAVLEAETPHRFFDRTAGNAGDAVCGKTKLDAQLTPDISGNCHVSWTEQGEWLEFDVNAATGGIFNLALRAASAQAGRTMTVRVDGRPVGNPVPAPNLGAQNFADVGFPVELTAGNHVVRVTFNHSDINLNYLRLTATSAAATRLPARIEAEAFTTYYDTTAANVGNAACKTGAVDAQTTTDMNGGCYVGWTASNEWLEYRVKSPIDATYQLNLRAATASTSRTLRVEVNGVVQGSDLPVPKRGAQVYSDISTPLQLSAGEHRVRVVFVNGATNLNYLNLVRISPVYADSDGDGVEDLFDNCAGSQAGGIVNDQGCAPEQLDDDRDGVQNSLDHCPATQPNEPADPAGCGFSQRDDDQDGIINSADLCPYHHGTTTVQGCAPGGDEDGDLIANDIDRCLLQPGFAELHGCTPKFDDFDSDGVLDSQDQCPYSQAGQSVDFDGCATQDWADGDFDGVADDRDLCRFNAGWGGSDSSGCSPEQQQDDDADGIQNGLDFCPGDFGMKRFNGCANDHSMSWDADQDSVPNQRDHCPLTQMASWVEVGPNGCALDATHEDADQDGVNNERDLCPLSPLGHVVDEHGCTGMQALQKRDDDQDGINNALDHCPGTWVDPHDSHPLSSITLYGCHIGEDDDDHDGVINQFDRCPWEPGHQQMDGCTHRPHHWEDADQDGVPLRYDLCPLSKQVPGEPATPAMDGCQGRDKSDFDGDGVINGRDLCPASRGSAFTDEHGCDDYDRLDLDQDGVMNGVDLCPKLAGLPTSNGCADNPWDSDRDGIDNLSDRCPYTPRFNDVDEQGCMHDLRFEDRDGDGAKDEVDQCRNTPITQPADPHSGCSAEQQAARDDEDRDGVGDSLDFCHGTPAGEPVDTQGCMLPWHQREDRDGDNVFDVEDRCTDTKRARAITRDGCEIGLKHVHNVHRSLPQDMPTVQVFAHEVPVTWHPERPHHQPVEFIFDPRMRQEHVHVTSDGFRLEVHVPPHMQQHAVRVPVRLHFPMENVTSNWFEVVIGGSGSATATASLIINDPQVLARTGISLRQAFGLLSRHGSEVELFRQFWDSQRSHSTMGLPFFCTGQTNGFPIVCDRPETNLALMDDFTLAMEMDNYRLTAVVNRMDLHNDWQDCGEHRLVFALQNNPGRKFLNLEARLPNPMPGDMGGCRAIAEFWRDLASVNADEQAHRLLQFFYGGPFTPVPAIAPEHFLEHSGQIRSLQFAGGEWLFKEHKLEQFCGVSGMEPCRHWVRTVTVKENPFGELFNPQMAFGGSPHGDTAQDFQHWFPNNLQGLLNNNPAAMHNKVMDRFNHGQSHASGPEVFENDYLAHFGGQFGSEFAMRLDMAARDHRNADGSPITVENILARATAMTCAGCHAPDSFLSDFRNQIGVLEMPDGTPIRQWPSSHDFVHINEAGELSPAMLQVFLPARAVMFSEILGELGLR